MRNLPDFNHLKMCWCITNEFKAQNISPVAKENRTKNLFYFKMSANTLLSALK